MHILTTGKKVVSIAYSNVTSRDKKRGSRQEGISAVGGHGNSKLDRIGKSGGPGGGRVKPTAGTVVTR